MLIITGSCSLVASSLQCERPDIHRLQNRLTHDFPHDAKLAGINKQIDRHVQFDYLKHKHHVGDLMSTRTVARSIVENLFIDWMSPAHTCVMRSLMSVRNDINLRSYKINAVLLWPEETLDTD